MADIDWAGVTRTLVQGATDLVFQTIVGVSVNPAGETTRSKVLVVFSRRKAEKAVPRVYTDTVAPCRASSPPVPVLCFLDPLLFCL